MVANDFLSHLFLDSIACSELGVGCSDSFLPEIGPDLVHNLEQPYICREADVSGVSVSSIHYVVSSFFQW